MSEKVDCPFVAIREIRHNDALAYMPGDLVHQDAVVGPSAWLVLGVDVEAREGAKMDMPPKNASTGAWAAFAKSQGADAGVIDGMSRSDLVKQFGDWDTVADAVKATHEPSADGA